MSPENVQRGITFECAASPAARMLASQVAETFGVEPSWSAGATRLVVIGPPECVEAFFTAAEAAITFAGRQPAAA